MSVDKSKGKTVSFIIPVRHPHNAKNWPALVARLKQTVNSISRQTSSSWCCVIVANEEAELPDFPPGVFVERVQLPPNPHYHINSVEREIAYEAVRLDKGMRVLAGMKSTRHARYFMVVDDDDFVSRNLVEFAQSHQDATGWYFNRGFVWSEGSQHLYVRANFHMLCGTSYLIRADLYDLPDAVSSDHIPYIKAALGSHIKIADMLSQNGKSLSPLPFIGSVYRVGHAEAHSLSRGVIRSHLINRHTLKRPHRMFHEARQLRWLSSEIKQEFGVGLGSPSLMGRSAAANLFNAFLGKLFYGTAAACLCMMPGITELILRA